MRVVLVVSNLGNAGAQRSNVNLANLLVERGHAVTLLTRAETRADFFVPDARVSRKTVDLGGGSRHNVDQLKRALAELAPDVVVASGNKINIRVLLACRRLPFPVVVVERNDPARQPIGLRWELARFFTYRNAARVVGISRGVLNYFWWLPAAQKALIHNTFPLHSVRRAAGPSRTVVAVGRLSHVKGFDRLVEAWSLVAERHPDWSLDLWGEGEERGRLESLIEARQVAASFRLRGVTSEPLERMAEAAFLVVPSRSEGFGNVLVEAMSVGIPVVSFDCPSGPRDILTDGVDGFLVPNGDVQSFADAMARLLESSGLRETMGQAALNSSQRFQPAAHADRWESLLQDVTVEGSR